MTGTESYETCLPDVEAALLKLAGIIGAPYQPDAFSSAEAAFEKSGKEEAEWSLRGQTGVIVTVTLEKYEGDLFITLNGAGHAFREAKQHLWNCYIAQGGNPEAQKRP